MITADLHNHTNISHGSASVAEMHGAALKSGLKVFGFSEHSPLPDGFHCPLYTGNLQGDFPHYAAEVIELKKTSKLKILLGLELDWLPSKGQWMRSLVNSWPFDYVLGSLHYLDGMSVGKAANWPAEMAQTEKFSKFNAYFYEMASMAASGLIQIASHPDFIKLRVYADFHSWLETPESRESIGRALESMAKNGVAMEVNSAGLRQDFKEPYPAKPILDLAHAAGVKICFGSDAHRPEDIQADFDKLAAYAAASGYTSSVIFINRVPEECPFT